jgi:hypothetical protein
MREQSIGQLPNGFGKDISRNSETLPDWFALGYKYFVAHVHAVYLGPHENNFNNTCIPTKYKGFTFSVAEQPPRRDRTRNFKHAPTL